MNPKVHSPKHHRLSSTLLAILVLCFSVILQSCNSVAPTTRPFFENSEDDLPAPEPEPVIPVRPSGAVFFNSGWCGCKDSATTIVSGPSCQSFCTGKNTQGKEILFVSFSVGDEILNSELKTLRNWCTLPYGNDTNPSCQVEAKSEAGKENINVEVTSANVQIDITSLFYDKAYILTLKSLPSEASSNSIQIYKRSPTSIYPTGPIAVQPVTRYSCIERLQEASGTAVLSLNSIRRYFHYTDRNEPEPVPEGITNILCHDPISNGTFNDRASFPRLESIPNSFALWSREDARFFSLVDSDGIRDINNIIFNRMRDRGTPLSAVPNLFFSLALSTGPSITVGDQQGTLGNTSEPMGYYLKPFRDEATNIAYCPNASYYGSTSTFMQVLGDVLQLDTEGLYLAKRETLTYRPTPTSPPQCMPTATLLVRETDLKKVWFYYGTSGIPTATTNPTIIRTKTMRFFYPFDFNSPYVKKSHQKEFTVILPTQLNQGSCSDNSTVENPNTDSANDVSNFPTHDKRIGCIPVSSN